MHRLDLSLIFFQERHHQLLRLASCDTNGEAAPPSLVPTTRCDPYPSIHLVRLLLLDHEDICATNAPRGLFLSAHLVPFIDSRPALSRLVGVLVRVSAMPGRLPRRRTRAARRLVGTRKSFRTPRATPRTSIHHNPSRQTSSSISRRITSNPPWSCRQGTPGDRDRPRACKEGGHT